MSTIRPVILCGGSGKRLWPVSRESYPKQFSNLVSENETMLQATLARIAQAGGERPLMLSANDYRFIIGEQLEQMNITNGEIIIEPKRRNTAPAICAAALHLRETDPNAIMVISPADHHIKDEEAFFKALRIAADQAKLGRIVTFGIVPDRAETGYGYIEIKEKIDDVEEATDFLRFTEKPDEKKAKTMLKTGRYLWNSGIFVSSAQVLIDAFEKHAPLLLEKVAQALKEGQADLDFFRLGDSFSTAEDISFDYAIMEHISGKVVPLDCGWNDLGSWETVWLEADRDQHGNALKGSVTALDCKNSLLRAENNRQHLVGLGLDNMVAIAMGDAVLIADKSKSQSVSELVNQMRKMKIEQADEFPRSSRPWGWFETLTKRSRFRVKSIVVKPGQKLSLQSHVHRAEHWVVVEGTAKVTIDDEIKMVTENESVFIPLGAKHRLENPGRMELHLIEVQTGSYLEEDDIVRYEDIYSRS